MKGIISPLLFLLIAFAFVQCANKHDQYLYHHEVKEREKNLDYCVIEKIHNNESNLISYNKTGHKNLSDTSHITYLTVRFHMNRGIEIEKQDSIAFHKTESGHWHCEECNDITSLY